MSRSIVRKDEAYLDWAKDLRGRYQSGQIKAAVSVNKEMLEFYWLLGRDIVAKDAENVYGSGFYETLSRDLKAEIPNAKGFSPRNIRYMRDFYLLFHEEQNLPQPVADFKAIPWSHINARRPPERYRTACSRIVVFAQPTRRAWRRARGRTRCAGPRWRACPPSRPSRAPSPRPYRRA